MTRVLMTADAVGGVWTYALELVRALPDVQITLAVLGPAPSAEQRADAVAAGVELHARPYALEWMRDPWRDVDASTDWLRQLAADAGADVIHLNGYSAAAAQWDAPTVVVAHSDVVTWWQAVHGCRPDGEWAEYERRVRSGLHAATRVIAPTAAALAAVTHAFGVRGTVVPNGRRGDWVRDVPKEPIVLGAGRLWDPAKNVAALAHVASQLDWPVVVAGSTDLPDGSDGRALALGDAVEWLGSLPFADLATWLVRAAVFASPARYEPFGLGALEAGLAGCALVLGDIAALREVWGDAALFVDPADPDELAGSLGTLVRDRDLRGDLAARARARARTFPPARMADGYRRLYAELTADVAAAGATTP